MLQITITTAYELREQFRSYNRDYYSFEAYEAMLDYFDEIETPVELDVISFCSEFSEDTVDDIIANYEIEINESEDKTEQVLEYINKRSWAVKTVEDKILYYVF